MVVKASVELVVSLALQEGLLDKLEELLEEMEAIILSPSLQIIHNSNN